jgi:glycosyltransferase involved in cell wall biosynthesis
MNSFFDFKWKYLYTLLFSPFASKASRNNDYLFIVHDESKDWILGSKARWLSTSCGLPGKVIYSHSFRNLPDAEGYFFLHQKYFARSIRYNPHLLKRKLIVMFTHPEWNNWYSADHISFILKYADHIVCLNNSVYKELQGFGIAKEKISMYHLAADPDMFTKKNRTGDGAIGFSMAFGPRKNPEMVVNLIKSIPDKKFILIGPNWTDFLKKHGVLELPNFTYYDNLEYSLYPSIYHQMDILVSTSVLEGGPVPLLEAMLCNIVPVASRTGFGPDIIKHGENGFLFNTDAPTSEIISLIEQAFQLKTDVSEGIDLHSWKNYGKKIAGLFNAIQK